MVTEETIEGIISKFEGDKEVYVESVSDTMDAQPALLAFLSQESNDVLTEDEKDIMWYITMVILHAAQDFGYEVEELSDEELGDNEETNWQVYQEQPKGTFREKVTKFFDEYEEEDLLAFVEDTLELDDDSPITSVGRDVIFICSKAIIDTITHNQK